MEKIIETKFCKHCQTSFDITDKDIEFYDKISPTFGEIKYSIPTPTLCPDCRQQHRLLFRNTRKLYKRKCDASGKEMIQAIRAYIATKSLWTEYLESLPMEKAKRALSNIRRILHKWSQIPKRIDAFEKKRKWSVIMYDILQDCTKNEFFKSIWCANDWQLIENFGNTTMNLQQIDYLCKRGKLNDKDHCMILSIVNNEIIPLDIHVSSYHNFNWNNYSPRLTKWMKVLLFMSWETQEK